MKKSQHKILEYPVIFEPAKEGGYNVSFPAFPGCVTFGRTFEQARAKAQEVLELWLEELAAQNKKIPAYANRPIVDAIKVSLPEKIKVNYAANNC
jgi:predicted RNase H-like HicB family nuclease